MKNFKDYLSFFKKVLSNFYKVPLLYLTMLSKRNEKIMIFGAWFGDKFADNPKYLYLQAIKDKSIKAVWVTRNRDVYNYMRNKGYRVCMYKSIKGMYYQLKAKYYFICVNRWDVFFPLLGGATCINLWHGIPLKKIGYDDKITNAKNRIPVLKIFMNLIDKILTFPNREKYIVSTSEIITNIYTSAFKTEKKNILEFGQPRNDVFFDNKLEDKEFPEKYIKSKVILYMPTHRNEGSTLFDVEKVLNLSKLNEFCELNGVIFLIKKHYYHRNEITDLSQYNSIEDITNCSYDSQLLLKYADILITDYSSCYIDFLLLNRPIIFYNFDYENYKKYDRELYFDYNHVTPGVKAKNFEELFNCIKDIVLLKKDEYYDKRAEVKKIFYSSKNQSMVGRNIINYFTK